MQAPFPVVSPVLAQGGLPHPPAPAPGTDPHTADWTERTWVSPVQAAGGPGGSEEAGAQGLRVFWKPWPDRLFH